VITRRKFLSRVSLATAGSLGFASSGFAAARGVPALRRSTLDLPRLPEAWDGLTIAQVADVHAGLYMSVERMQQIRSTLTRLPVDLMVFTGDQIDRREIDAEMFADGFRGIEAPLGVYGVLGNHDYYVHRSLATAALAEAGITPLIDQSVVLRRRGTSIALVGVDDLWSPSGGPDFDRLRHHQDAFRICLCHQPQGWHSARAAGADLTLSGHTHGGQIALPTQRVNLARLTTRYVAGPYRYRGSSLYVSRGIGVGAVPLRVGSPPEIDVITLRSPVAALSHAA
jgi:predicted MPP superfamily phosphohydrolase